MGGKTSKFEVIENGHSQPKEEKCICNIFCKPVKQNKDLNKKNDFLGTPIRSYPGNKPIVTTKKKIIMNKNNDVGLYLERERSLAMLGGLASEVEKELLQENKISSSPFLLDPVTAEIHYSGEQLSDKYTLCEVLGVGSTSTCYRCVNIQTGDSYACKIIDKKFIAAHYQGMVGQFQTEIMALKSLHHPNIIRLYDVYVTAEKIYIVMELMLGGELFDYVVERGTLKEIEAADIMKKITSALVYMHSKNIIHRDLKPENLLLVRKPLTANDIEVKIIDFGLSKQLETQPGASAKSFLGTRGYLAPEMLQRLNYSSAVDTWALGVILYVLLCGCLPFDDDSQPLSSDDALRARFVLRFPRWARNLSTEAKDLLSHLLDIDPNTRYTAQRALNHAWMDQTKTMQQRNTIPTINKKPIQVVTVPHRDHRRTQSHSSTNNPAANRQRSYSDQSVTHSDDDASSSSHLGRSSQRSRATRRVRKFHTKKSAGI